MIPAIALVSGIVQLAPALAKLFGAGDVTEAVADKAAEIARAVTGQQDNEDALTALKNSPELVMQYQTAILAQEKTFEQLYQADKESARLRDTEFLKAGTRNFRADFLVGVTVLIILSILCVVVIKSDLDEFAKGVLTTILGVFLNQLTNIFSFEFGTTRKEEDKNKSILTDYIKR